MERSRLAAYVDGSLEPEEAAAVVIHLADSPEDQAHVERLVALNRMLTNAYGDPVDEPVPQAIYRTIFPERRTPLPDRVRGILAEWFRPAPLATFAAVAVFAWVAIDRGVEPTDGLRTGIVDASGDFYAILENSVSGWSGPVGNSDTVTLIAVFHDQTGRPCREYELQHDGGEVMTRGIACRDTAGGTAAWEVAMTASERIERFGDGTAGYIPADGPTYSAVSAALDNLGAGPSLTPDQERALITGGWQ